MGAGVANSITLSSHRFSRRHLHKSGDVVLNSVDATNGWSNRKKEKSFDDLFH
jgi:hypothetical protein